jgi:hypothetical protein
VCFVNRPIKISVSFHYLAILKDMRPRRVGQKLEEDHGPAPSPALGFAIPQFHLQALNADRPLSWSNFDHETLPRSVVFPTVHVHPSRIDAGTVPETLNCSRGSNQPNNTKDPSASYGKRLQGCAEHK